jgi:hypothetical protein
MGEHSLVPVMPVPIYTFTYVVSGQIVFLNIFIPAPFHEKMMTRLMYRENEVNLVV